MLAGTIQEEIGRVRITAHLFRIVYGKQFGACEFDEKAADLFDLQNSTSDLLSATMAPRLRGSINQILRCYLPTRRPEIELKSPKTFRSHRTTAITTTAFRIPLMERCMGM